MSFSKWMAVVVLGVGCGAVAQAQIGIYGMYTGQRYSGIPCPVTQLECTTAGGHNYVNPTGGFGGVYYDFRTYGPVRLGLDVRAGALHTNKSAYSLSGGENVNYAHLVLGGVRGSFKTPIKWLEPYGEVLAGWNRNNVQTLSNYVQYEVKAGADVHILPVLDLRLVELGIGEMTPVGGAAGVSSMGVKSIGVGMVLRLP